MSETSSPSDRPVFPTGVQYEISGGGYRAVVTELGATLRLLQYEGRDLIHGFGPDETIGGGRGQQLIPWPNRIRDGRYTFDGTTQQLPLAEPDRQNAMHGLVRWTGWRLVSHEPSSVTLQVTVFPQKGWPTVLDCTLSYRLSAGGLEVDVEARNVGAHRAPFGYGAHPYLTAGEADVSELELVVPAARRLRVDDRMLPVELVEVDDADGFRTPRRVGDTDLDTAFTGLDRGPDGRWRVSITGGDRRTTLWADENHRWTQVFTGNADRTGGLAVEPMTCGPDAFNDGPTSDGLVVLEPGAACRGRWGIYAG
ncbi:aldose 1-epimerase [Friedmanniella endophytica]|uniref:Aldose 1-epimerase n=1 Tax=Microlunatus kandeliicorticis TaxID=1759536 RepID=A0A7W3P6U2_9ACTN|nr:aldose 1-epimerase family protein [Microlunatus kandeliicorticis]MBA8795421.1 aldose 1-epimerase [Microlunatus kandeliicorticis]